ncbi:MAG: hypothetical protein ABJA74_10140 [Lapillicoccus sp.]
MLADALTAHLGSEGRADGRLTLVDLDGELVRRQVRPSEVVSLRVGKRWLVERDDYGLKD